MKSEQFDKLVKKLHGIIDEAPKKLNKYQLNEEWTKVNLILPLIEGLGWDRTFEIHPEARPVGTEGWIDYLLNIQEPQSAKLCIEAKSLLTSAPEDRSHNDILKGLEQTEQREASYFIWTNGDIWQIYAVSLPYAPTYEISLRSTRGHDEEIKKVSEQLCVLERREFSSNPKGIDDAILANWKMLALPAAFDTLLTEQSEETLMLFRKVLPVELGISAEEILAFLSICQPQIPDTDFTATAGSRKKKINPCPEEWEKLISSLEPKYQSGREKLLKNERRKLGEYLIGDNYKPWPQTITFNILGLAKRGSATKTVTGPAVALYKSWGFIRIQNPLEKRDVMYERNEEAISYLTRLLDK